jgi:hypothetical protein
MVFHTPRITGRKVKAQAKTAFASGFFEDQAGRGAEDGFEKKLQFPCLSFSH